MAEQKAQVGSHFPVPVPRHKDPFRHRKAQANSQSIQSSDCDHYVVTEGGAITRVVMRRA
jgi:hypothetical protein